MLARNESHEIGLTLRAMLMFCDSAVVLVHACTDNTGDIVQQIKSENPGRVQELYDHSELWDEMGQRNRMLACARGYFSATHIWLGDADELLTGDLLSPHSEVRAILGRINYEPIIREHIERTPCGTIMRLPGYNLRHGIRKYHNNGIWGFRWFPVAFVDDPVLSWSGDRFHSREPGGRRLMPYQPVAQFTGGVMHLWASSLDRLRAKHKLYRCVERVRWPQKPVHEIERMYAWAEYGEPGHPTFGTPQTWTYADVPDKWWAPYADLIRYLDIDAKPWQDAEADRLIAQHGREYFKGLRI